MKVITEPTVTLLAFPVFQPHPNYKLPPQWVMGEFDPGKSWQGESRYTDAEGLIAHAGKGCYDSYGEDGRSVHEHIKQLIGSLHGSVLEHVHVSFFIEGISRGCSHEIVRHRLFNYSQRSTRYTAEDDAAIVLEPYYAELYKQDEDNSLVSQFLASCAFSLASYVQAVHMLLQNAPPDKTKTEKRKWARGKARQLLPHALETRMTMTGNLRGWRHFIEQRSSRFAEPEIRRLAAAIYPHLANIAPAVFEEYTIEEVDGIYEFTTPNRKV